MHGGSKSLSFRARSNSRITAVKALLMNPLIPISLDIQRGQSRPTGIKVKRAGGIREIRKSKGNNSISHSLLLTQWTASTCERSLMKLFCNPSLVAMKNQKVASMRTCFFNLPLWTNSSHIWKGTVKMGVKASIVLTVTEIDAIKTAGAPSISRTAT